MKMKIRVIGVGVVLLTILAPPYRGGRVEVLEKGVWKPLAAAWQGDRIVIPRELHVYDTLAVKILRHHKSP